MNRNLHMDDGNGEKSGRFDETKAKVAKALESMISGYGLACSWRSRWLGAFSFHEL